jgi:hypothetical protein
MRSLALVLASTLALPALVRAIEIQIDLPEVLPRMVAIQPGVAIVPEVREETFFHDGWYWVRRNNLWFRSRDHRGGWVVIPQHQVPPRLVAIPPGLYGALRAEREIAKGERGIAKGDRKVERRREKEERRRVRGRVRD